MDFYIYNIKKLFNEKNNKTKYILINNIIINIYNL
jgi:hypothetical protein